MTFAFVVGLILAQSPAAVQPQPVQPVLAEKPKHNKVCRSMEVTGSRVRRMVCRNEFGDLEAVPGVASGAPTSGMVHAATSFGDLGTPARATPP